MKGRSLLRTAILALCMIVVFSIGGGGATAYRGPGSGSDVPSGAVKVLRDSQRGFTRLPLRVNPFEWDTMRIGTSAHDADTGTGVGAVTENARIVDRISYYGFMAGSGYIAEGVLVDKSTGEPLIAGGREVRATVPFYAEEESGTVDVVFEFDASALRGKSVVVYESVYEGSDLLISHRDIDAAEQTVIYPDIGTSAESASTGTRMGDPSKSETIRDTVSYSGLIPGREYTIRGKLMDRDSGEPIRDESGNEITAEKSFTPDASSGTETLEFTYDSSLRHGRTTVVFEDLYYGETRLVSHADIGDAAQSVTYPDEPAIGTTLTGEDGVKKVTPGEVTRLTDEVRYENLTPGKTYILKGRLVVKSTGETLRAGGAEVTAEKQFTPDSASGTVEVVFEADLGEAAGESLVAFEKLTGPDGEVIASHEDIDDAGQTVEVEEKPEEPPPEETPPEETPPEELKTEPEPEPQEEPAPEQPEEVEKEEVRSVVREETVEKTVKTEKPEIKKIPKTGDLETAKAAVFILITGLSGALLALLTRLRRYDRL